MFRKEKPGYYKGRHYTEYVEDVEQLKRRGKLEEAASLLIKLVEATESESRAEGIGVAPWYYEQLAIIHSAAKDYVSEVAILERFARQKHAPGRMPDKLLQRLDKAKARLAKTRR